MNTAIFSFREKYLMLALDQRDSFKKLISQKNPESVTDEEIIKDKTAIIKAVGNNVTGILIDREWGMQAYRESGIKKPFLIAAEKTGYIEENEEERLTQIENTAADIRSLGASGVKLLIYFNTQAKNAPKQIDTARKVLEETHNEKIPFFLEIVRYNQNDHVSDCVKSFLDAGVVPDVFKIEPPVDRQECAKITQMLGKTPWIILTRGVDFNLFCKKLRESVAEGGSGFLAGRSLWQELLTLKDANKREEFLAHLLPERVEIVKNIALGE